MLKVLLLAFWGAIATPLLCCAAKPHTDTAAITVPFGGNAWVRGSNARIDAQGLSQWSDKRDTVNVYVRFEEAGTISTALRLKVESGESEIAIAVGGKVLKHKINNTNYQIILLGSFDVKTPGYIKFSVYGISKTGSVFADITDLSIHSRAAMGSFAYVKDNHGNFFYWGHRGPSVHLKYQIPDESKNQVEWFYNEVTVPVGEDKLGSYFMADGFSCGYFGMQVNSATERHILFSVWSPFTTNDPKSIPDSLKIQLLKKGDNVHTGEFGNEGSGGQSYLNYPWVAGKTYAFLLHAVPEAKTQTTTFTAYFKETTETTWRLIACFKRPKSGFSLNSLHSFLENFNPQMGDQSRKVYFGNQWIIDRQGDWHAISDAVFTGDETANINFRKDYGGGAQNNLFYLRNGGFFNDFTILKTKLHHSTSSSAKPAIDFKNLPAYK